MIRAAPRKSTQRVLNSNAASAYGSQECPTCQEEVGLRKNGDLRAHRVGSNLQNAWPCRGADTEGTL